MKLVPSRRPEVQVAIGREDRRAGAQLSHFPLRDKRPAAAVLVELPYAIDATLCPEIIGV